MTFDKLNYLRVLIFILPFISIILFIAWGLGNLHISFTIIIFVLWLAIIAIVTEIEDHEEVKTENRDDEGNIFCPKCETKTFFANDEGTLECTSCKFVFWFDGVFT